MDTYDLGIVVPSIRTLGFLRLLRSLLDLATDRRLAIVRVGAPSFLPKAPDLREGIPGLLSCAAEASARGWFFANLDIPRPRTADMALRLNFGVGLCPARRLLFLDDDELAPPDLADRTLAELAKSPFAIGQYRDAAAIRYGGAVGSEAQDRPPQASAPALDCLLPVLPAAGAWEWREALIPTHTFLSSYGGCLAVERGLFYALGGFDEVFLGARGTHDQDFALRAARVLGLDPYRIPFSHDLWVWHDLNTRQEAGGSQQDAGRVCHSSDCGMRIADRGMEEQTDLGASGALSAIRNPQSEIELVPGVRLRRCPRCGCQRLSDNHQLLRWRVTSGMNLSFLGPRRDPLGLTPE